jgi:hypothetical protein
VPTGDGGELISAAYALGVAHPPGYPLYTMLGYLATHVPGVSPALGMNLLSALLDALAVGVVFLVVQRLVQVGRWTGHAAAAVGSLLLAFSSLYWAYSVVAEVFALNNLFAAVLLLIAIEWRRRQDARLLWLFAFVFGLALGNQQTIALFLPAFLVLAWRPSRLRDLGIAAGAFAAGLLPYAYLPIAASQSPAMNWGDPTTFARFVTHVTRGNYGSTSLSATGAHGSIWQNLRLLGTSLAHGFVYAGILLAAAGLWWAWQHRRVEGIALLTAFLVAGPLFEIYTDSAYPSPLQKGIVARFYILPSIPLGILSGLGAWWILAWARRPVVTALAAAMLLAIPGAAAADHYSSNDQSSNYVAANYGDDMLGLLAPRALLIVNGDENYTSLAYAQVVQHLRPDVVTIDSELLKLPSYVAQLRKEHPGIVIPQTSLNDLIAANLSRRPVYAVGAEGEQAFGKPFDYLNLGLVTRLLPKGAAPNPYAALRADPARFESLHYPTRFYAPDSWERVIVENYAGAAASLARALGVAPSQP